MKSLAMSMRACAPAVGIELQRSLMERLHIGRSTVYWWEGKDHLGFKSRLREADEVFTDDLDGGGMEGI